MRELYLIKSNKTEEWEKGVRKISFACDDPDIHAFVWVDPSERLIGIQIIFRERVLEWDKSSGVSQGDTTVELMRGHMVIRRVPDQFTIKCIALVNQTWHF